MVRKLIKWVALIFIGLIILTLFYGFVQYPKAKGVKHFVSERIVYAPKERVWEVISDVGNYHKVTAAGIDHVTIVEGQGLGMKRVCSDPNGNSWEETCTVWKPGEEFQFVVNTAKEDYELPFKSVSGKWKLDSITQNKTKITVDLSYEFKNPFLGGLFLSLGEKQARKDSEYLLNNWQRMSEDVLYENN